MSPPDWQSGRWFEKRICSEAPGIQKAWGLDAFPEFPRGSAGSAGVYPMVPVTVTTVTPGVTVQTPVSGSWV